MSVIREAAAVVAVLVVLAGVGVAYSSGVGPFSDGADDDVEQPESRGDVYELDENGSVVVDESSGETPPLTMTLTGVSSCGQDCREVSMRFTNQMDEVATGVVVYTRVYAGNGTDGYRVWAENRRLGRIAGGTAEHISEDVELGWQGVPRVSAQDGWVTIETTVESDQASVTFVATRKIL